MKKTFISLVMCLTCVLSSLSAEEVKFWPLFEKLTAVESCKNAIVSNAIAGYLKKQKISVEQLPSDYFEKVKSGMEAELRVCDCVFNKMEQEYSFEYFATHQNELQGIAQKYIVSGECPIGEGEMYGK